MRNESIFMKVDVLNADEYLKLESNHVMNEKTLTLSFKVDALDENAVIRLGHGEKNYGGSYLELTKNHLKVVNYTTAEVHNEGKDVSKDEEHGLDICGAVNLCVAVGTHSADITVSCGSGFYQLKGVSWAGRNGEIFAVSTAMLERACMRWSCSAYGYDTWLLGDSYFNFGSSWRWPYYLRVNGYTKFLLMGYPGRNSVSGLNDFKQALTHGTPKTAVWCLGMNDGDTETEINANYKRAMDEFLEICAEKGITPILSTVPCTPIVRNHIKNELVRSSGYRYVDFAFAVGAEENGSTWYPGMLHTDNVHPNEQGAKALYGQFIADFPEICK